MSCRPSVISYDVTLRGGLSAGKFTPIGHVDGMEACVNLCCKRNTCDIALMLRDSCYSITCASEELCEEVPAPSSDFYPRLSYVRRDVESQAKKGEDVTKRRELGTGNRDKGSCNNWMKGLACNGIVVFRRCGRLRTRRLGRYRFRIRLL